MESIKCVPGIPIKRYNPCISPTQEMIPHVIKNYNIEDGKIVRGGFVANSEDYPEYAFIIQNYIDNNVI